MGIGRWGTVAGALAVAGAARGAEVTDMPPPMGGSAMLAYGGSYLSGGLQEQGIRVADRRFTRHDLDVRLELSPVRGAALTLGLSTTPAMRFAFPGASPMIFDPIGGSGTYLSAADLAAADDDPIGAPVGDDTTATGTTDDATSTGDAPGFSASGLNGIWIGAAVAPFSQSYSRYQAASWRLDLAFRTPNKANSLWVSDGTKRGTAPGGTALRLRGAWSTDLGVGEPYLVAQWHKENRFTGPTTAPDGTPGPELELRPASTIGVTGGIELAGYDDAEGGNKVAFDLFGGCQYTTWQDVATGVYLPDTLASGRAIPVTTSEHVSAHIGAGVNVHAAEYVRARVGMTGRYATPHRQEHLYDVLSTWDSFEIGWYVNLGGVGGLPQKEAAAE